MHFSFIIYILLLLQDFKFNVIKEFLLLPYFNPLAQSDAQYIVLAKMCRNESDLYLHCNNFFVQVN